MKVEGRPRLSYPSAVSPRPKLPDIFLSPSLPRLPAAMSDGPEMAFLGGGRGLAYFTLKRLGHIGILELPMEGKRESCMFCLG